MNELYINIGDSWKEADSLRINIGDVWKNVESIQINIGDVWKTAWKRKADYFKVRYRSKNKNGEIYRGVIGITFPAGPGAAVSRDETATWANYETAELQPTGGPWTAVECAALQVRYTSGADTGGEIYYISEIEIDIYDAEDNLLDTVKPNSDDTLTWDSTGASHYTEVDQGISSADDAKYVYTAVEYEAEYLGLENPSW